MNEIPSPWAKWRRRFESRAGRPVPKGSEDACEAGHPSSLARSLAIFQLGESGGGTVVGQAHRSRLAGVDEDYVLAMALFVEEEHRHADVLALCVRRLGGTLIERNWTDRLFVATRRMMGLRTKVLVLLAAEVVGICYYHLLAEKLAGTPMAVWLAEIVEDEKTHLEFHCAFLRRQTPRRWQRWAFVAAWRTTMALAAIAVLIDHRAAIRDLSLDRREILRRWVRTSRLAERLVVGRGVSEPGRTPREVL